ncbi:MAG: MlaE family lipid ABC transporter permease subunit [Desulfovibrionaceae bacterium]|nr:MlaE family lipid ABC transporter permease subunit [Desulfovibrionaceae bacterium]
MRVVLSGALTAHSLTGAERALRGRLDTLAASVIFDLQHLALLDTSGALFLNLTLKNLRARRIQCSLENLTAQQEGLLKQAVLPESEESMGSVGQAMFSLYLARLGKAILETGSLLVGLMGFLGRFLVSLVSMLRHPSRMRWTPLVFQMEQVGLRAVPIVSLLTFLIGLVVAYMGAQQLAMFGADIFAVNLLEVTVLREMAVLITSIVVAGRSSSSFTAQIGAMMANQEVDALRSMGLDPMLLLVVPRVLALVLTLPMLVFIANIMALFGGAVAIYFTIDLSFSAFLTQLGEVAKMNNFLVGMIKTPFFALSIGLVGCFQGFRATGSAESVGFLTTVSVVQSIFTVILLNALFAIFFSYIGM